MRIANKQINFSNFLQSHYWISRKKNVDPDNNDDSEVFIFVYSANFFFILSVFCLPFLVYEKYALRHNSPSNDSEIWNTKRKRKRNKKKKSKRKSKLVNDVPLPLLKFPSQPLYLRMRVWCIHICVTKLTWNEKQTKKQRTKETNGVIHTQYLHPYSSTVRVLILKVS